MPVRVRDVFGVVSFFLVMIGSCHKPEVPDGRVRAVTAYDLVKEYRTDVQNADLAFTGQVVRVRVTTSKTVGSEVHWKLVYGDPKVHPVVLFRFDAPTSFHAPGWIEGVCRGRVADNHDHGSEHYHFTVLVTECRVVQATLP